MTSTPKKSTIVRSKEQRRTDRLRRTLGILERAAPRLGAHWAWNLWTVPMRPSPSAVEKSRAAGIGEVRRITIELPDWTGSRPTDRNGATKPPQNAEIAVELLGPPDGPGVYLLHGWAGWRGQFAPIGRALAASGYRVILIDAPNHGDSGPGCLGGRHTLLPDFSLALEAVAREFGPAHAVVGHSLGGGCTALAVLDGLKAERAVFISPAIDPVAYTKILAGMLGFGERIRGRMVEYGRRRTGRRMEEFVIPPRAAGRTDLPPALVVHDAQDPIVTVEYGKALAEAWTGAHFIETSGLGHNRILRNEAVVMAVVGFIAGAGLPTACTAGSSGAAR